MATRDTDRKKDMIITGGENVYSIEVENAIAALTVTDDGTGISEIRQDGQGMGLRIMAYRAGMIGGSFDIERLPGRGTRVTCKFPATPAISSEAHAEKK